MKSERILGRVAGEAGGPVIVVMAGIHGNEPAGLKAAERVIARLRVDEPTVRGELVVLRGNLAALAQSTRFVDEDLNRMWSPQRVAVLRARSRGPWRCVEDREQYELLGALEEVVDGSAAAHYFLDLHTSSADGPPFLTVGDTIRNRAFALRFPMPIILGLEEQVDGALLEFLNNSGFITLGVEAGRHDAESSIDRQEAVLWLALVYSGFLEVAAVPELARYRGILERASRGMPRSVEVRRRHAINSEDGFSMEPGFANFQAVEKGCLLARDKHGLVLAPDGGRILLPLYHGKGNDGFFLARDVKPFWLLVSILMRRLRAGNLIRVLPGIRRHADNPDVLVMKGRMIRRYPLEMFFLLGFRKLRRAGDEIVLTRRHFDLKPPQRIASL
jgi:succinylglutamate desuccinylase